MYKSLFLFFMRSFKPRYVGVNTGAVWIVPTSRIRLFEATLSLCEGEGKDEVDDLE